MSTSDLQLKPRLRKLDWMKMELLLNPRLPGLVMARWLLFHNSSNGYQSMLSNSLVFEVAEWKDPLHDGTSRLCKLSPFLSVLKINGNILEKNINNGKIDPIFKIDLKVCLRTLSSLGKKKNGMDMTIRETPQMRNPPHHIPIHRRSEESLS